MKYTFNAPKENETSVEVTFEYNGKTITRSVNAVFTDGEYDKEQTENRVASVSLGVINKVDLGLYDNHELD